MNEHEEQSHAVEFKHTKSYSVVLVLGFFLIIQLTERIAQVCENNRLAKESKTKALNRIISLTSLLKITPLTGK